MGIARFLALGDSITEGLSDRSPRGGYRGWADRVADELTLHNPDFGYANFAVRGKLLQEIISEQLPRALELTTGIDTLISFHAGANNVLRPQFDLDEVKQMYRHAVKQIADTGSQLVLFTIREVASPKSFLDRKWNERFIPFNDNVRATAADVNALLIDANGWEVLGDPRMLAADRLHLSSEGHRRMAAGVLHGLDLPHDDDWLAPLPPLPEKPAVLETAQSVAWAGLFVVPWLLRRITGRSSGDRRSAKYPQLTAWPPAS